MILRNWSDISKCLFFGIVLWMAGCKGGATDDPGVDDFKYAAKLCDPGEYDLSCMKDDKTAISDAIIDFAGGVEDELLGEPVDAERQDAFGEECKTEIEREYTVLPGHAKLPLLEGLLHKLLKLRQEPSEIQYNIYVIRAEMVNAFTVGGEIYVTTGLLDDVKSTDELACVIGHEVGHNELGHIGRMIKKRDLARGTLGNEAGDLALGALGLLTMGFNQTNEAESDLYGIDLALAAGYDACRGTDFWRRMKQQEGDADELNNFFRTHPYSSRREACYVQHLKVEHDRDCGQN